MERTGGYGHVPGKRLASLICGHTHRAGLESAPFTIQPQLSPTGDGCCVAAVAGRREDGIGLVDDEPRQRIILVDV